MAILGNLPQERVSGRPVSLLQPTSPFFAFPLASWLPLERHDFDFPRRLCGGGRFHFHRMVQFFLHRHNSFGRGFAEREGWIEINVLWPNRPARQPLNGENLDTRKRVFNAGNSVQARPQRLSFAFRLSAWPTSQKSEFSFLVLHNGQQVPDHGNPNFVATLHADDRFFGAGFVVLKKDQPVDSPVPTTFQVIGAGTNQPARPFLKLEFFQPHRDWRKIPPFRIADFPKITGPARQLKLQRFYYALFFRRASIMAKKRPKR